MCDETIITGATEIVKKKTRKMTDKLTFNYFHLVLLFCLFKTFSLIYIYLFYHTTQVTKYMQHKIHADVRIEGKKKMARKPKRNQSPGLY